MRVLELRRLQLRIENIRLRHRVVRLAVCDRCVNGQRGQDGGERRRPIEEILRVNAELRCDGCVPLGRLCLERGLSVSYPHPHAPLPRHRDPDRLAPGPGTDTVDHHVLLEELAEERMGGPEVRVGESAHREVLRDVDTEVLLVAEHRFELAMVEVMLDALQHFGVLRIVEGRAARERDQVEDLLLEVAEHGVLTGQIDRDGRRREDERG